MQPMNEGAAAKEVGPEDMNIANLNLSLNGGVSPPVVGLIRRSRRTENNEDIIMAADETCILFPSGISQTHLYQTITWYRSPSSSSLV